MPMIGLKDRDQRMRCLHCGKRLSLLRKFSDGEFCSAEHRQLFQHQQNDLALARLIESQVRIERPKPKEPPKSQKQPKAAQEPADQLVPEAPLLTEWFGPVRKRVVFVPANLNIPPEIAQSCPLSGLAVTHCGFLRPDKLPLNWTAQPAAISPAGIAVSPNYHPSPELPALGVPAPPVEVPEMAGLVQLTCRPPAVWASIRIDPPAPRLPVADEPRAPRLALLTQPPDPVEIPPEEEIAPPEDIIAGQLPLCAVAGLVFAEAPLAPAAMEWRMPVPVAEFSTLETGHVPARSPALASDAEVADEDSLMAAIPLRDVASLVFDSHPLPGTLPAMLLPLVSSAFTPAEEPSKPVQVAPVQALEPGVDDALQPVETAPAFDIPVQCRAPRVESLAAESEAALPDWTPEAEPIPGMTRCNRTARLKTKAMAAAAGASFRQTSAHPLASQQDPVAPRQAVSPAVLSLTEAGEMQPLGMGNSLPARGMAVHDSAPAPVAAAGWVPLSPRPSFQPEIEVFESIPTEIGEEPVYAIPVQQAAFRLGAPEQFPPHFVEPSAPESDEPAMLSQQIRLLDSRPVTGPPAIARSSRRDDAGLWVESCAAPPMMRTSRLTLDHADGSGRREVRRPENIRKRKSFITFDAARLPGRRFWSHAPADLKWVALGLPLILAIVIYSFKGNVPKMEPGQQVAGVDKTVLGAQLNSLQRVILNRAAVKRYDDFRGGLGSWQGGPGWSKSWKYGEASFLEPGQLALYTPTLGMTDYTVQFLGQIERRSLNWVFRAKDEKNYYAMRIVITKAGPLPEASVVRYAVINGKEQSMKSLPIPFPVRSDTLYLVRMDVSGNRFTTYIQGGIVDSFEDDRLESGGVGFYSPRGDRSFLRWVEVTHQYDYLGRLCALLAPYNVQGDGRKTE
jgi:hypothetical protein